MPTDRFRALHRTTDVNGGRVAALLCAVGLAADCGPMTSRPPGHGAPVRGLSAWTYEFGDAQVAQIRAQNAAAPPERRFRWLFPYAGSVSFGPGRSFTTSWSGAVAARYAAALGPDVALLPIFDGRQDHGEFEGWSATEYEALAAEVAGRVIGDPHAAGVQVDIEPFRDDHLPFYEALGRRLRAAGRLMTGFVSPGRPDETLRRMYAACDLVVLSGYDLEQPDPGRYGATLERHLARCDAIAAATRGGRTLVGVPAAGSWAEHEYTGVVNDGVCTRQASGFRQDQWLAAALRAVAARGDDPTRAGLALWCLTGRTRGEPGECRRGDQPDFIGEACWRLLRAPAR